MQLQIAPSILSADYLNLGKDILMLNEHADLIHIDVMDGTLVPNISIGFPIVEAVRKVAQIPMDAHLMIVHPQKYFKRFADCGISMLSFHIEAAKQDGTDPADHIREIHSLGMKAGIALNPDFPVEGVFPYLKDLDFVVVMSVFAGFGGQKFIEDTHERVKAIKKEIRRIGSHCLIQVDGGVNNENAPVLAEEGVDIVVAGSSVFKAQDPSCAIRSLRVTLPEEL